MRGLVAGLCLALACAACSSAEPDADTPSSTPTKVSVSPSPSSSADGDPTPTGKTTELRLTLKPRNDGVVSVRLPKQKPGGTMIGWSAYLVGVGTGASPTDPRKVECYVVQATGPGFDDRVVYVADDSTNSVGLDVSMSGTGLVDTADGKVLFFECELDDNDPATIPGVSWRTLPGEPIQVTLTPVPYERREITVK